MSPAAGDSALAARLLTDVAAIGGRIWIEGEKLKVDAPSGALNEALQSRIRAQRGELVTLLSRRETGITPIVRTEGQVFPLSLHQHAFFMLDQMEPGHAALNVVSVRRIREPIDPDRFCAAVRAVALRHESLRTVFAMQAGRAVQRVVPLAAEPCTFKDLSGLDDAARRAAIASLTSRRHGAAFDLAAGPLFGLDLLSFGQADFVTCLRMHHIVSDAVSIEIFYGELIAFYHAHGKPGGPGVPPLRLHYADYAAWQDRMLRGGELDGQIDYWRRRLDGVPPLLPRLNAAAPEDGAITVHRAAAPGLRAALHRRAQALKVSPFSFLLAMFHLLLARATRSADIPVIVPVSGRARPEVQPLIGLFVSGLVLRAEVRPEQTLGDFAAGIADEVARALGAQDVSIESLEGLARQRRLPVPGLAALSKIGFNYLTPTRPPDDRLAVEVLDSDRTRSVFDMFLVAVDGPDSLSFKLEQRSGLFAAGFAERLLADFAGLVEQASGADGSAKLFAIAPRSQADICAALGATGARIWPLDAGALGLAEAPALPHHACGRALTAHGAVLTARLRAAAAIWPQLASALLRAPAPLDAAYLVARANWPEDAARSGGLCVVTHARDMLTVRLSPLIGTAADAEALAAYLAGQAPTLPDGRGATQVADAALMPASWDLPAVESLAPSRVGQEQSTDCLWLDAPAASMVRNAGSGFAGRAAILLGRIAALADPEFDNAPVCVLRDTPEGHGSVDCVAHGNGAPGLLWLMLREVIEAAASARLVAPPGGLAVEILLATDGRAALRGSSAGGIDPVATLRRFAAGLRQILGSAAPDGPLDLLLAEERRDWERLNAGWRSGLSCDVITRLRRFAEETPAGEAICADGTVLSYAAVAGAMDGIAGSLAHLGASPRAAGALRVGVMVSRGAWLPLAPLGILAAGGTYVPLDPALPDQALAAIGARLDLAAVLADAPHVARAGELFGRVLDIEAACRAEPPPLRDAPSDAPAYVMFTSGSTGQPKAVEIGRPALWSFLAAVEAAIPIRHGDRMLAVTSPGFDISLLELFLPLCGGGTVVIAAAEDVRNGEALSRQLRRHAITHLQATPSLWRLLVEAGWKGGLRLGISGGEALAPALARQLLDRCGELWNFYGPTEATVWCCFARVGAAALDAGDAPVPIGMPLANSRVYVTDPGGALVPPGVAGELLVGGDGLAGLYLGDAAKTAAAFFELPGAGRVYRTGDRACLGPAGLVWLGRKDRQVKLRGQRIELAGVEAALQALPGVREAACVLLRAGTAEALLAGFVSGRTEAALPDVRRALRSVLPPGSLPDRLFAISALPRLINGKVDYGALGARAAAPPAAGARADAAPGSASRRHLLGELWAELLGHSAFGADDSFFDVGGHSILVVRLRDLISERTGVEVQVIDLFSRPRITDMASLIEEARPPPRAASPRAGMRREAAGDIAIIGMSARFPGAATLDAFWDNLLEGRSAIRRLSERELLEAGLDPALLRRADYVRSAAVIEDADRFDAAFFRISPREAALTDPQHRLLLEHVHAALEDGGYGARPPALRVGLFAGAGFPSYFFTNLQFDAAVMTGVSPFALLYANEKDYAVAQIAYRLDLRGPCMTVATACSTGLVAVHQACRSLAAGECGMAVAAAAKVMTPMARGYVHSEGGIVSPDGMCRPFDAAARGTVFGSGVAAVLLKPLDHALRDGDPIRAVIRGSAVNNDGAGKIGLTAPSRAAQSEVLSAALLAAGVPPASVGFIEAHGTGTALGDPIELSAIAEAYGSPETNPEAPSGRCLIGAVKGNVGHLDPVAGLAGLVKTVLALETGVVPPTAHFERPNPAFRLAGTRFAVNGAREAWPLPGVRRASVSAFGIGGTNAHVVLEQAPGPPASPATAMLPEVLPVSAQSEAALAALTQALAAHFEANPGQSLTQAAATLQLGRAAFRHRSFVVATDPAQAARALRALRSAPAAARTDRPVYFLFPGQSGRLPDCGGLYRAEPLFREAMDRCCAAIGACGGPDLRAPLGLAGAVSDGAAVAARQATGTLLEQPALFAIGFSLSAYWQGIGLRPAGLLGHSLGEWVAAVVAGVMTLEAAARLIVLRSQAMQACPAGAMAAVYAAPETVEPWRGACEVAAHNAAELTVIAGADAALAAAAAALRAAGCRVAELHVDRAFHSRAMRPAQAPLHAALREVALSPPAVPIASSVTGDWITEAQATDPAYWSEQITQPVRFDQALCTLLKAGGLKAGGLKAGGLKAGGAPPVLLELGLRPLLAPIAARRAPNDAVVIACGKAGGREPAPELGVAEALGRAWSAGLAVDWQAARAGRNCARVRLPTYPFERQRHWIESQRGAAWRQAEAAPSADPADWVFETFWLNKPLRPAASPQSARWVLIGTGRNREAVAAALRRRGADFAAAPLDAADAALDASELPAGLRRTLAAHAGLGADDADRPLHVLVFWPAPGHDRLSGDAAAQGLAALDALIGLGRCLARDHDARPVRLAVIAAGLFVPFSAMALDPVAALALGPVRGLPRELQGLRAAAICADVTEAAPDAAPCCADAILAEFDAGLPDAELALSGSGRMVPLVQPSPPPGALPASGRVMLITGGLGDLGMAVARRLADEPGARLTVLGRRPADDPAVRARLSELPPGTLYVSGSAGDPAALAGAVAATQARFGGLDTVFHLAGSADGRLLDFRRAAHTRAIVEGKVLGALHLCGLQAEHGFALVLFSSVTGRLVPPGQIAYGAANAALDALAGYARAQGRACTAIAWDAWAEIGMAARGASALPEAARSAAMRHTIPPLDGLALLHRLAAHPAANPIVCPAGWAPRLVAEAAMRLPWIAAARDAADAEPALAPAIGGPDRERALIALWERHLGVTPIDLDDDFFDLGGNSLLAVSMLRALEAILGRRLSPDILLRAPTIRMLSAAATEARALRHLVPVRGPTRETAVDLPPLVLVHPIGGEVLVYRAVVERLEPGRAVYGLRFGAADIGRYASVTDMAAAYAAEVQAALPGGNAVLAGSSFGGIVALEMARLMTAHGPGPAHVVMIDSPLPGRSVLPAETDADILAYIGESMNPVQADAAAAGLSAADIATVLAVFRANQALMDAHVPAPFDQPVVFLKAAERRARFDPPAPDEDWRDILPNLAVQLVPGDHVSMHAPPHAGALAGALDRIMAAPGGAWVPGPAGADDKGAYPAEVGPARGTACGALA